MNMRLKILEKVLQALDTDIVSAEKLDVKDSYVDMNLPRHSFFKKTRKNRSSISKRIYKEK